MNTKLTLKLDDKVIRRAKTFAQSHNTSLSRMIESYLDSVTGQDAANIELTPLVESLSGVVRLPEDFDYKTEYANFLAVKYK